MFRNEEFFLAIFKKVFIDSLDLTNFNFILSIHYIVIPKLRIIDSVT